MGPAGPAVLGLLLLPAAVRAAIGPARFPATGYTAPMPGFPSATFPLFQYGQGGKGAQTVEASPLVTFENLRNLRIDQSVDSSEILKQEGKPTTTVPNDIENFYITTEKTVADQAEVTPMINESYGEQEDRGEKSLLGTFPFPGQEAVREHVATSNKIDLVASKKFELLHSLAQNGSEDTSYVKGGRRCVDKVMMVEETVYDEVLTCDHSYDNRCHTSYVTKYEPHQQVECEENFKKTCYIEYEQKAYTEKVQVCTTPWIKDCREDRIERSLHTRQGAGDGQECRDVYESECATRQTVHEVEDDVAQCKTVEEERCNDVKQGYTTELQCDKWPREVCTVERKKVKKYTPDTSCRKVPKKMCSPRGCGIKEGPAQCRDKLKTIVVDNPVEECDLEPIKICRHVTKLVPQLVATQECVDVPKEICARSKVNPRKVRKPAVQKWCYAIDSTDEPPPTESPNPDPAGCLSDTDCTAGYTCILEEGQCRARPGKVLVKSITVRTASCTGCSTEGVVVSLEGERIGGAPGELPAPVPCTTGRLDRAGQSDFGPGKSSRWEGLRDGRPDGQERVMLAGCYEAPLNAMVRGGSLEWRGEGTWVPDTVCVDWKSTNMAYQCRAVPKGPQAGAREWTLVDCRDMFPAQSCERTPGAAGLTRSLLRES